MVETKLDIRFSADNEASVILASNAAGDVGKQAELVCFAHYAATTIALIGQERALPLADALTTLEGAPGEYLESIVEEGAVGLGAAGGTMIRLVPASRSFEADIAFRVLARFLNAKQGPRIFFSVTAKGEPASRREPGSEESSVEVLLLSLLQAWAAEEEYVQRLSMTAGLIGKLAAGGGIFPGNEFDVALAAADLAWRPGPADGRGEAREAELRCPACGNRGSSEAFEFRLWPSRRAVIRKCRRCGKGLWARERRRVRAISHSVWGTMEEMRQDLLTGHPAGEQYAGLGEAGEGVLLDELRRAFVENGWPFSEVRGASVLVSDLSGPLGIWKFYAQVVDELDLLLLYSVCPLRVPVERRSEISQFLTRANYGLAVGNFELDFEDGEIRYKTVLQLRGDGLDSTTLKRLVRSNGLAMETYLPGIGAVITGTSALPALERRTLA